MELAISYFHLRDGRVHLSRLCVSLELLMDRVLIDLHSLKGRNLHLHRRLLQSPVNLYEFRLTSSTACIIFLIGYISGLFSGKIPGICFVGKPNHSLAVLHDSRAFLRRILYHSLLVLLRNITLLLHTMSYLIYLLRHYNLLSDNLLHLRLRGILVYFELNRHTELYSVMVKWFQM